MATRVHRIGTIYSRVHGLMLKGHVKESEKPIWFDVYRSFPPKYTPTFKRTVPDTKVRVIFYEEDKLRAKIHKALKNEVGLIDLSDNKLSLCESLLKTCQDYIAEGLSEDEAVEKLKDIVKDSPKVAVKPEEEDLIDIQKTISEIF